MLCVKKIKNVDKKIVKLLSVNKTFANITQILKYLLIKYFFLSIP